MADDENTKVSHLPNVPVGIRPEFFSYLFSDVGQSKDHKLGCPANLLVCRTIYLETVSILDDKRCPHFDIRSVSREVVNRHKYLTMSNFRYFARPIHDCERLLGYVDSSNPDYSWNKKSVSNSSISKFTLSVSTRPSGR